MKLYGHDGKKGLTLIELVVVMAVLSVLAAVSMPLLKVSVKRAKEMELRRDLRQMRDAIDAYKKLSDDKRLTNADNLTQNGYPKDLETLVNGVDVAPQNVGTTNTGAADKEVRSIGEDANQKIGKKPTMRLLRSIPVDPMTGKAEWGMRSSTDDPDSRVWGADDVFDVYSLSDGVAMDGSKYKDW